MYQPVLNRFLSRDPLPPDGQPDILYDNNWFGQRMTWMRNTYGYASNNPVSRVDPIALQDTQFTGYCGAADADCAITIPLPFLGDVTLRWPCGSVTIDPGRHRVEWSGKGTCPEGFGVKAIVASKIRQAVNTRLGVPCQFTTPCPKPCQCEPTEFGSFPIKFPFNTKQKIYCKTKNILSCWEPEKEDAEERPKGTGYKKCKQQKVKTERPPEGMGYKECELDIKLQIELDVKLSGGVCR